VGHDARGNAVELRNGLLDAAGVMGMADAAAGDGSVASGAALLSRALSMSKEKEAGSARETQRNTVRITNLSIAGSVAHSITPALAAGAKRARFQKDNSRCGRIATSAFRRFFAWPCLVAEACTNRYRAWLGEPCPAVALPLQPSRAAAHDFVMASKPRS
jgi:hypothetical protein